MFKIVVAILVLSCPLFVFSGDQSVALKLDSLAMSNRLLAKIATFKVYDSNGYQLAWNKRNTGEILTVIQESKYHGLNPEDYHLNQLTNKKLTAEELDILATDAYLSLAKHILVGKINPVTIEPNWTAKNSEVDLASYLIRAIKTNSIKNSLNELMPQKMEYKLMLHSLMNQSHYTDQE